MHIGMSFRSWMARGAAFVALGLAAACGAGTEEAGQNQQESLSANLAPNQFILFQGFHWESHEGVNGQSWYQFLESQANYLADSGISHVWFPPVSDAASDEGYLPRELNKLDSFYGSEAQLRGAIGALGNRGIRSVADIVVNHRVGTTDWADFTNPDWPTWYITAGDEYPGEKSINGDSGDDFSAARDIDHINPAVRGEIAAWMNNRLKSVGFSGWRFDYVRGFAPGFVGDYVNRTDPEFCVGELWNDYNPGDNGQSHRQDLMNWINGTSGTCAAFDFTTKGIMNYALRNGEYWRFKDLEGRPAGAIGWWPSRSVTFVDNHDTGPSYSCFNGQNHWPVPCDSVMQGYAYILTHPGVPTVYAGHFFNWGLSEPIRALTNVRISQGLNSESSVNILEARQGLYAAIVDGKVAVKLGWENWSPGQGWNLATSGDNYAVWTR